MSSYKFIYVHLRLRAPQLQPLPNARPAKSSREFTEVQQRFIYVQKRSFKFKICMHTFTQDWVRFTPRLAQTAPTYEPTLSDHRQRYRMYRFDLQHAAWQRRLQFPKQCQC